MQPSPRSRVVSVWLERPSCAPAPIVAPQIQSDWSAVMPVVNLWQSGVMENRYRASVLIPA